MAHAVLEAHEIVGRALPVLRAQLDHGERPLPGAGIDQSDRAHGPEAESALPPAGQLVDRQARFEERGLLELVQREQLGAQERLVERMILLGRQRTVQVMAAPLVPAVRLEHHAPVDGLGRHDGCRGVVAPEFYRIEDPYFYRIRDYLFYRMLNSDPYFYRMSFNIDFYRKNETQP